MHKEIGKCNCSNLYGIFENICPDVIFEEIDLYRHQNTYKYGVEPDSPELKTVFRYIQNHDAESVAVDTLKRPENYHEIEEKYCIIYER